VAAEVRGLDEFDNLSKLALLVKLERILKRLSCNLLSPDRQRNKGDQEQMQADNCELPRLSGSNSIHEGKVATSHSEMRGVCRWTLETRREVRQRGLGMAIANSSCGPIHLEGPDQSFDPNRPLHAVKLSLRDNRLTPELVAVIVIGEGLNRDNLFRVESSRGYA
jgi:hypothetical protein